MESEQITRIEITGRNNYLWSELKLPNGKVMHAIHKGGMSLNDNELPIAFYLLNKEKPCKWYVTDKQDATGHFQPVHCEDDNGYCLVKDFYTSCNGKCEEYCKEQENDSNVR